MMDPELARLFSLQGRLAVITGAASGIGRETARVFARAGASLVLADRDGDGLHGLAQELGGDVLAVVVDVAQRQQVDSLAARAQALAPIAVWANAAGVVAAPALVADTDEATLDRVFAINLKGTYWGCAAAARHMAPQRKGSIINISSAGADIPSPGISVYSMFKASINMLTRTLATELGASGVRVNAIAPGFIDTPMVSYRFTREDGSIDPESKAALFESRAASAVLGRVGEPLDIAAGLLFLASDASSFMTGEIMRINGGSVMPG